ncbi:hypothetical protein ACRRTK_020881 [Alexandromys fortis]
MACGPAIQFLECLRGIQIPRLHSNLATSLIMWASECPLHRHHRHSTLTAKNH